MSTCPSCKKELKFLKIHSSVNTYLFADGTSDVEEIVDEYVCQFCGTPLAEDEEEALKILNK
jgi:hypothetical protein